MRALTILSAAIAVAALGACSGNTGGAPPTGTVAEGVGSVRKVPTTDNPYTLFETLQVRPLALSADGSLLFAANTPDNRLEIFRVHRGGLQPVGSVLVGLEPVAVAARPNGEVWVVNHLSDCVSIVHVDDGGHARVVNTLLVGDEPRDIVFAGPTGAARSSPPRTAGRTRRTIRTSSTPPAGAPTSGCSTRTTRARRAAAGSRRSRSSRDTPRALAASRRRQDRVRRRVLLGQPDDGRLGGRRRPGLRRRHARAGGHRPGRPGDPAADDGAHREVEAGPDGNTTGSTPTGRSSIRSSASACPTRTSSPSTRPRTRRRRRPPSRTSARRSSTWPSTRRAGRSTSRTPTRTTTCGSRGTRPGFTSVVGNIVDSRISVIDPGREHRHGRQPEHAPQPRPRAPATRR